VTGRHRNPRPSLGIVAGSVALVLVAVLVGWGGYRLLSHPSSCGSRVTVNVAAAPEIAPAIQATADQWAATQSSGTCYSVSVTAVDPADVAASLAAQKGATLTGLGQAGGKEHAPDVWIADSSTWLQRVQAVASDTVPAQATSIAQSPVVLAMPQPLAKTLGWPGAKLTWGALLQKMTSGDGLKAGIVEPARDASGLSGLLALGSAAAAAGQNAQAATVAGLRSLANNRSTLRADLVGRFPRSADPAALGTSLAAAPLPEEAVIAYNAAQPPVPLAGVFLDPAPAPLDYPYATVAGIGADAAKAARDLLGKLTGAAYKNQLAQHGLRAADGSTGAGFSAGPGTPPNPAPSSAVKVDAAVIGQTLNTWSAVTQPGRILAVVDVSGSMKTPVPTAGGKSREQVTVEAAAGGLGLFGDDWSVGLWTFSTKMDGNIPYRQLVGIGTLSSQRAQLAAAMANVVPTSGDTGLYDTVLAAYKAVQQNWDPGKINSVVLMTDGQNDNPGGLTLDQLTTQLKKIADPAKRVQVIAIGIGEASQAELEKITQVTGGGVFIVPDPSKIGQIFLQAIALRPGSGG
jgi:Ca-activated chloride channel homolog